ncbi:MAG: DMT family transporter [Planctomycetota bacterium]|nr:DMT family transporter [Planctomycetota bacterium]
MESRKTARWCMLAAALLFSTGGAAIKGCGFSGWQVAGFRSGIAALALFAMIPAARRGWNRRQALVGLAYAATLILYVLANKLTTAANAIFLQSTAPLYMLVIAPLLLKEPVRRRDLGFMAALAVGLALFFAGAEPARRTATDPLLGNVLGACSAITWALTVAGLRWIAREEGAAGGSPAGAAAGATVLGNLFVFVVCIPFAFPVEGGRLVDWALVGYLGVFQIGLAYVFMTAGMRRVPALEGALLLLVEPVLNTVWAWLVHGEVPGPWSRAGALIILLATAAHALRQQPRGLPSSG